MAKQPCLFVFAILSTICNAGGLIGYGSDRYPKAPFKCPYICQQTIVKSALTCTTLNGPIATTSPACYASNDAFLETLAYCMKSRCADLQLWQGEKFWKEFATGSPTVAPKYSYGETLERLSITRPNATLAMGKPLDIPSKIGDHDYRLTWTTVVGQAEGSQIATSRYAIALVSSALLIPIVFSLLRFVSLQNTLYTKVSSYLIMPATWGTKHRTPVAGNIGVCPTRGQSLFIFFLCALNFLLCVATYRFVPLAEQTRFKTKSHQLLIGMGTRIGHLTVANLALLILFAGRNNFLLWITKWSRSTFLLFHHWLGYIVILEASVHASIFLYIYVSGQGFVPYSQASKVAFWRWGTAAGLLFALIYPLASLPIRQRAYEVFLALHRLMALFAMLGAFFHTYLENAKNGYHIWVIAAFAALGFDYLMRMIRIARNGVRMAEITIIDDDYVRVDIKGPTAEGHAYIYFPTLTWRFWESHPFSVAASVHDYLPFRSPKMDNSNSGFNTPLNLSDAEKGGAISESSGTAFEVKFPSPPNLASEPPAPLRRPSAGVTFFIRRQKGLTSLLGRRNRLPVLIESSYGSRSDVSRSPNLIAIAGGVGIVTVLPLLHPHPGRTKLYWSMRTPGLLDALKDDIKWIDREVSLGARMDIERVLENEVAGENGKGACVVVSGPPGMSDEVRRVLVKLGKRKGAWPVRFVDESFG
ncbi:ferric reductase-like protein transmembrane component 4 [Venturia nashicola]|uniref:Ferric reductase-like protein transmembrane component 4 n=1 Tax=Venturia nashicola TaxID=86259 RepID=A0A4Z1P1M3_9PEZI|nr:ferric reductase-like protein transmembrane component 4 [Venturia nashicola]